MTSSIERAVSPSPFPDHTQLPDEDGTFVKNFQEHPQSIILTDSIIPLLDKLHPNGDYAIGQDCGIYWRETNPPENGAEAPDWFYVSGVPDKLDGNIRRSYVLPLEGVPPLIALEFASGNGSEERDKTPLSAIKKGSKKKPGKYWVYEQKICIPYYGIYEIKSGKLEVYKLINGFYQKMQPNQAGRYLINELKVELGLWQGSYKNQSPGLWLRWWDTDGNLLLIGKELAQVQTQRAQALSQHLEAERQQAEIERQRAEAERQQAEIERQRAEAEHQRAEASEKAQRDAIPQLLGLGLTIEQIASVLSLPIEEVRSLCNDS
jgi:Uma2 family endonuclease